MEEHKDTYILKKGNRIRFSPDGLDYAAIRARFDGTDPTPSEGQLLLAGDVLAMKPGTPARFVLDAKSTHQVIVVGPVLF